MALDLATLINEIESAYQDAEDNPGAGNRPLATAVATAINKFVKTGKVKSGIGVQVDPNTGVGSTNETGEIE